MSQSAPARFLHVANGTCTTDIIEKAGIPGAVSIWADPLYEGPVPGGLTDEELLDARAGFLGSMEGRRWRQTISVARDGKSDRFRLQGTVTLTDAGREVLTGRRDRVATFPIDRWLGGVHLQTGFAIWRWDDQHERMTRS